MDPFFQRSGARSVPGSGRASCGRFHVKRRRSDRPWFHAGPRYAGGCVLRQPGAGVRWAGVLDGRLIHGDSRPVRRPSSRPTGLRHEGTARPDTRRVPSSRDGSVRQAGPRSGIRATSAQRRTAAHPEPPGPAGSPGSCRSRPPRRFGRPGRTARSGPLRPLRPLRPLGRSGRSVARSLGRSVARSLGRSVARSLGRSVAPASILAPPLRTCEGSAASDNSSGSCAGGLEALLTGWSSAGATGTSWETRAPRRDHFGPGSPTPAAPGAVEHHGCLRGVLTPMVFHSVQLPLWRDGSVRGGGCRGGECAAAAAAPTATGAGHRRDGRISDAMSASTRWTCVIVWPGGQ